MITIVNENQYHLKGDGTMALSMMAIGETKRISEFRGKPEMKQHLQNLGFQKGAEVKVVGENPSGLILLIKDVRIALNRGLASMILVD